MRNTLLALLTLLTVLAFPASGFCGTDLSYSQVLKLKEINTKIAIVHEMADRQVITTTEVAAAETLFCQDARAVVGHDVTPHDIQVLVSNADKTERAETSRSIAVFVTAILLMFPTFKLIDLALSFLSQDPEKWRKQ